jgi:large subunit ribosomal protein L30
VKSGGKVRVRQTRSGIGYKQDQKDTLRALGLGRIGKVREHPDNEQVRGMIAKVTHLVEVEDRPATGADS